MNWYILGFVSVFVAWFAHWKSLHDVEVKTKLKWEVWKRPARYDTVDVKLDGHTVGRWMADSGVINLTSSMLGYPKEKQAEKKGSKE